MEGAVAHVLTDLYAFMATVAAAIVVLASGFARADAIATLVVVVLMLHAGVGLIRGFRADLPGGGTRRARPGGAWRGDGGRPHVAEVHDLHIWEITTGMPAASAHVLVQPRQDCHAVRADLEQLLARDYGITHLTLQVDHVPQGDQQADDHGADEHRADARQSGDRQSADRQEDHQAVDHHSDDHVPSHSHCGDSHGPAYRPARRGGGGGGVGGGRGEGGRGPSPRRPTVDEDVPDHDSGAGVYRCGDLGADHGHGVDVWVGDVAPTAVALDRGQRLRGRDDRSGFGVGEFRYYGTTARPVPTTTTC